MNYYDLPMEIELTANLRIGSAGVGNIVAVEGHHVGQHVSRFIVV